MLPASASTCETSRLGTQPSCGQRREGMDRWEDTGGQGEGTGGKTQAGGERGRWERGQGTGWKTNEGGEKGEVGDTLGKGEAVRALACGRHMREGRGDRWDVGGEGVRTVFTNIPLFAR